MTVHGEATISMTVDLETYDRLSDLFRVAPSNVVLKRLLDRDPHDHDHACPTCARLAKQGQRHDRDQPGLFVVG
jgi:predicted dithiol-disulfide oxidoreductase (DUF899 family)